MLDETLTVLRVAYPRAEFPPDTVTVYVEMLADLPDGEVAAACKRIILRSMFLPTVAEIRREVAVGRFNYPVAGEAWQIVLDGKVLQAGIPPLSAAYEAMGGRWALRVSSNVGAMRHSFERDYDQRVERILLAEMGALPLPPAGLRELEMAEPSTPVERRMADRMLGRPLTYPPSTEEKCDAIRVLRAGPSTPEPLGDAIYCEAERIFREGEVPKWKAPVSERRSPTEILGSIEP